MIQQNNNNLSPRESSVNRSSMKNLSAKQIESAKKISALDSSSFHGNRKTFKGLPVSIAQSIINTKFERAKRDFSNRCKQSDFELLKSLIEMAKKMAGTNYQKIMIEGNTGIYLTHPEYLHDDYNKSRVFDKNEKTLKLMHLFNSLVSKL